MPDDLTFLMGKFPAVLPGGLRYARNHMWCRTEGGRHRFGFTSYAVRLMQDVYFLDWSVSEGDALAVSGAITWAGYSVALAPLMRRYSPFRLSAVFLAVVTVPLALAGSQQLSTQRFDFPALVWLGFAFAVLQRSKVGLYPFAGAA